MDDPSIILTNQITSTGGVSLACVHSHVKVMRVVMQGDSVVIPGFPIIRGVVRVMRN